MDDPTKPIIDQAVEEAAQTLFDVEGVPMARTDELLAALQGPAVRSVFEARVEQIVKHGHTAAADADRPLGWLPNQAKAMTSAGQDLLTGERKNLPLARKRFARAAAMLLAAIDRVDRAIGEEGTR